MPRYRFDWVNLPDNLLLEICEDLGLDVASPAEALRAEFGVRPREAFVRAAWPTLRDAWLESDSEARTRVVGRLYAAGLGNGGRPAGPGEERAYLASCRNAATLRGVVLAELIRRGEGRSDVRPPRSGRWTAFQKDLAATLDLLTDNQYLILDVDSEPVPGLGRPETKLFVQFADQGSAGLRAEAVSNAYLPAELQLDRVAQDRLHELGWSDPTSGPALSPERDPEGSTNYFREWTRPVPHAEVAAMAVDTLVDVFGAVEPSALRYEAFDGDGNQLVLDGPEIPRAPIEETPGPVAVVVESLAELTSHVADVLADLTGDVVQQNDGGDFMLPHGSALTFIRPLLEPPAVMFFSPLLTGIEPTTELLARVNEINSRISFGRLYVSGTDVIAEFGLVCRPFVPGHVAIGCQIMSRFADDADDALQEEFGGKTFFGDHVPPKTGEPYGGYL